MPEGTVSDFVADVADAPAEAVNLFALLSAAQVDPGADGD